MEKVRYVGTADRARVEYDGKDRIWEGPNSVIEVPDKMWSDMLKPDSRFVLDSEARKAEKSGEDAGDGAYSNEGTAGTMASGSTAASDSGGASGATGSTSAAGASGA